MSNDTSREAFEAWAVQEGLDIDPFEGEYLWKDTDVAWITWQASRDVALNEAAEVCRGLNQGWYSDDHHECVSAIKELMK